MRIAFVVLGCLALACNRSAEPQAEKPAPDAKVAPQKPRSCEEREGSDRALCLARRCFDQGARAYSATLPAVGGGRYQVGKWQAAAAAGGSVRVTLQIRAAGDRPRDASWEVSVGQTLRLSALDADAATISREHNSCR